nr:hypothetical protein [Tanacetum cinerariifolium]
MTDKYFVAYTGIEVKHFRDTLLQHMGNVKKSVFERARHQKQYDKRVNKRLMQTQKSKIDMGKAVNDDLVVTESSGTESEVQDDNSRSGNDIDAHDEDIRPIYDEEPMAMEKVFAIAALKNDLRKLKGNSVDTKFAITSVLGKPVLQPLRNQSVVRQLNAFKHERPPMSKQRFSSQVDVNHNLSKPVTRHYLPKKSKSAFAKPDHMIASSSSRNSYKNMPRFSSNDMVHNYYLDGAKKKTQERDRNSKPSVMTPARFQSTTADSKPKPRSTIHSSRSFPMSKSNCVTIPAMPKAYHSKSPSSFSDHTRFFGSTCNKCFFNANHTACITKLLKEVNLRAKIQSHKIKERNKPVYQKSHTQIPGRQIFTGHKFSPNKTFAVYKKISPRSDLRWKPTGRIFKSVGLRWLPTGKLFDSCTSTVESKPTHGSNEDISKIHECKQTLDLSAEGIQHQTSVARTPEQNGIVERWNRTLVEAARTKLSAAKVHLFFWAEAIATVCFTQNHSLVIPRHKKTPYHIINDRKPSVKFFYIFGSVCYIVRDGENLDKMNEKGDECIFVGYSNQPKAYRVFNKRTRVIMESIHVNFDELPQMASDQNSSDPVPECQTMALNHDSLSPANRRQANFTQADRTVTMSNELDLLFSLMFDELLNGSSKVMSKSSTVSAVDAPNQHQQHTTPLNI